jgi:hypothetical protein
MNTRTRLAMLVAVLSLLTSALHAQVPQLVNYHSRVAVGGVNFDGADSFKFAFDIAASNRYCAIIDTTAPGAATVSGNTLASSDPQTSPADCHITKKPQI